MIWHGVVFVQTGNPLQMGQTGEFQILDTPLFIHIVMHLGDASPMFYLLLYSEYEDNFLQLF